jgi:beta-galactosidase/beta-glucuronidase
MNRKLTKETRAHATLLLAVVLMAASCVALPRTMSAQAARVETPGAREQSLDGGDWLLGSFAMDSGVTAGAEKEHFDEGSFRRVVVPGEVQLQVGLKGEELFHQTAELTSINQKEWWYRKHFIASPPAEGKRVLLQFEGADYFASVWLNGKLLGNHEGK